MGIDWLMELPRPLDDEFWFDVKQNEEKEHMPFITTPQRYGRMEGLADGIETVLEARFPGASSQVMSEIRQIFDHEQLKNILRAAATVASPDELRTLWTNGSERGGPQKED